MTQFYTEQGGDTTDLTFSPDMTAIDLNPPGFTNSQAFGINDGQQVGVGFNRRPNGVPDTLHALLWRGTAGSMVDLNPSGFLGAEAFGTSGGKQVGLGLTSGGSHALLWSDTAASVEDLHVSRFTDPAGGTVATGITGNQQVGWKQVGFGVLPPDQRGVRTSHALLWSGTAGSVVDLHPPTFDGSRANGVSGEQQVGVGRVAGDFSGHARLWSGSPASVTALDESGFDTCTARGISGGQQVGNCLGPNAHGAGHAVLWSGGVLDLNPSGFAGSQALGTNGTQQVGWGVIVDPGGAHSHALVWSGSASRVVDLHQFLRQGNFIESVATGIDARGNIAGYALANDAITFHAFLWTAKRRSGPAAATFRGEGITFATFSAHLGINSASKAFEVNSTFTLGRGGTISPSTQPVTIQVGNASVTIPAGSFTLNPNGKFVFNGVINGVALGANLIPLGSGSYSLKLSSAGVPNLPTSNPVPVGLTIGNNTGSAELKANFGTN